MTSVLVAGPTVADDRDRRDSRFVVTVLVAEQAAAVLVGALGAFDLTRADVWLRALLLAQLGLNVALVVRLFPGSRLRPRYPLLAAWAVGGLVVSVAVRGALGGASSATVADALARLFLPLVLMAVLSARPTLLQGLRGEDRRVIAAVIAAAAATVAVLGLRHLQGLNNAWLSGDPVLPLLAVPVLVRGGRSAWVGGPLIAVALLLSGKRFALLAWAFAVVLSLVLVRGRRVARAAKVGAFLAVALGLLAVTGLLTVTLQRAGSAANLVRAHEVSGATSKTEIDPSTGQRVEEIRDAVSRAADPPSWVVGAPFGDIVLENGIVTHAIHNTPIFMLTLGGPLWLASLIGLRSRRDGQPAWLDRRSVLGLAAIVVLLDANAANVALSPSFACALAILV